MKKKPTIKDSVTNPNVSRYFATYAGQHLDYPLDEVATWQIFGEDPNCDFGGSHSNPDLGLFTGTLLEAITHAVELKGFWQWGGGGHFRKVTVNEAVKKLPAKKPLNVPTVEDLKKRVAKVKAKQDEEIKQVVAKHLAEFSEFLADDRNIEVGSYSVVVDSTRGDYTELVAEKLRSVIASGGYKVTVFSTYEINITWTI
jgi:hypothetical protein